MACLVLLSLAAASFGRAADDDGFEQIDRRGLDQIDRLNEALHYAVRIGIWAGIALVAVVVLKVFSPFRIYNSASDRLLLRAVRDVDDLLKRIQKEAETATEEPKTEAAEEGGLLTGMLEVAEFSQAEQVPSYVLTVNDAMLDNVRVTLRRLRRFNDAGAERYRDQMFSVVKGIKTLTEESEQAGVVSGLAVDIGEYFRDDRRYKDWQRLLGVFARKGKYQETADTFLVFMRNLKGGRLLTDPGHATISAGDTAVVPALDASEVPDTLSEETLAVIQEAAAGEAGEFIAAIQIGGQRDATWAWQFEFVRRQQQIRLRDEAQRMLGVFLSHERGVLREITRIKMLPCRTWQHILHMLGVASTQQLRKRIEDRFLTTQEIVILEKAFLQTFAKRESLKRIYGRGADAALMMDVHLPEIRRETLALLRQLHGLQLSRLDGATETLNDEETPQNNQVKRLIEHYVHQHHDPPAVGAS